MDDEQKVDNEGELTLVEGGKYTAVPENDSSPKIPEDESTTRHILGLDTHDNDGTPPPPGAGHYERLAYNKGLAYTRPPLTDDARIIAGYIRDKRPDDIDDNLAARTRQKPIALEEIHSSVSGRFIDDRVFADSNILLEILQNAEPKDSKGTWFDVEFYAKGQWRRVTEEMGDFNNEQIEKVRILDNGKGYMPKDMTTLGGGKRLDPESAGQFGSGMKISDRSALGRGVKVTRYSRNWRASPHLKPVITSAGEDATVSYNVAYFEESHPGSVVEYENITPQMLDALRKIQDIYLPLDSTLEERLLKQNEFGLILKPKEEGKGVFMVKGRSYVPTIDPKHPLLYSYDLHDCRIDDQNRHFVDTGSATENMRKIWGRLDDKEMFLALFKAHDEKKIFHEHKMDKLDLATEAFMEATKEHFKIEDLRKVYLDEEDLNEEEKKLMETKGIKPLTLKNSSFLHDTLHLQIPTGKEYLGKISRISLLNSKLDDYEEDTFAASVCRAIGEVDRLADKDKRSIRIKLRHKVSGEKKTIPYIEFLQSENINKDYNLEGMIIDIPDFQIESNFSWGSEKKPANHHELLSRFDPLLTAFLATGIKAKISNGHYELEPEFDQSRYYGRPCAVTRDWSNFDPQNFSIEINVENAKQASELKELHKHSLELNPEYKPLEKTADGDIVEIPVKEGILYENGVKKSRQNQLKSAILSYNFKSSVDKRTVCDEISKILNLSENADVPIAILNKAKADPGNSFLEYEIVIKGEKQKKLWREAFEKVFGGNKKPIVLDDVRDMGNRDRAEKSKTIAGNSNIEVVEIHYQLASILRNCEVNTLSGATLPNKVLEYVPDPAKEALMTVSRVVDEAIARGFKKAFPELRFYAKKCPIHLVKKIWNSYGQEIKSDQGYLDPLKRDQSIYIFDNLISNSRIDELITYLLNSKIEAYRGDFNDADFWNFRGAAMGIAERSLTSIEFIRKIRTMIFNKKDKTVELVERVIGEMENDKDEDKSIAEVMKVKPEKAKREKKSRENFRMPKLAFTPEIAKVLAKTALAAGVVIGGLFGMERYGPEMDFSELDTPDWLKKISLQPENKGLIQPGIPDDMPVGVDVERGFGGGSKEENDRYRHNLESNFISTPKLSWGYFMSERAMTKYNGKGWEHDNHAPDFADQQYSQFERFAHYQNIGTAKNAKLRTRSGAKIDPKSIKVVRENGDTSDQLIARKLSNGEYEVKILDSKGVAVMYQTLNPTNWHATAESLTDKDFANLDRKAYEYYTQTPNIDLSKIRFKSEFFPELKNLGEFVDYLRSIKPIERINTIRAVIGKMRYTITERTERAFHKFHNNELPEKDFLEFTFNSDQIENPGDGDCDGQNTIFALLARFSGIPTKMDFVFTEEGAHAPASIFLPKIGWILSDTMGDKQLVEKLVRGDRTIDDKGDVDSSEEAARRKLVDEMRRRTEFMARKCYEVD